MPSTAENQLKRLVAQKALSRLALLQGLVQQQSQEDEVHQQSKGKQSGAVSNQQHQLLREAVQRWLSTFPSVAQLSQVAAVLQAVNSVVSRNLAREVQNGLRVLATLLPDLENWLAYLQGTTKATNVVRDLLAAYRTGSVPARWHALLSANVNTTTEHMSLNQWMAHLSQRLAFLLSTEAASKGQDGISRFTFVLGSMFAPEAFIIAMRQLTAQVRRYLIFAL